MSDETFVMTLLLAALFAGGWFAAYCARKSVEAIQASTRVLELLHDILELQDRKTQEDSTSE